MSDGGTKQRPDLSPLKRAFLAIEELQEKVATLEAKDREPIAIVGIGCRFPGGVDGPESLVRLLRQGQDAVVPEPPDGRPNYQRVRPDVAPPHRTMPPAGFLTQDVTQFDPQCFGIAPREAVGMDPQQRLLLEVAWEALEDAAESPQALRESATGVFIGVCGNDYAQLQIASRDTDLLNAHFTSGIGHSVVSGRLSYFFGFRGPSISVDTACSSSLVAAQLACRSLRSGESDLALAGGVNLILDSDLTVAFMRSGMLSPDGRCKTFADGANGFARGEGCGVVVLKRLSSALADGNRIYAVIKGVAVNQDGPSSALSAPSGPAQEAVIKAALDNAGLKPADIDYVEAHGTGTELGDPIEIRALGAVFGRDREGGRPPLAVGSLKTNVGHLEAAAGIAGLIKVAVSLERGFIPRHLHCSVPSRHIPWSDLKLEVVSRERDWPRGERVRRAGVSSFGFSGTNCHIVLEEAPPAVEASGEPAGPLLLTLSAATKPALTALARRYAEHFKDMAPQAAADACFTSNIGRAHLPHRLAIIGRSSADLASRLAEWADGGWASGAASARIPVERPRVAFAFTGQGSQYAGMGRGLYASSRVFRDAVDECRDVFKESTGADLQDVLFGDRPEAMQATLVAQPALFVLEAALARTMMSYGVRPAVVLGHSIGEYAAACTAGVLSLRDGVILTARRGELTERRTTVGGMLAVTAPESVVAAALERHADRLSIAAVNGPQSVVVSGAVDALDEIERAFGQQGVRTRRLHVNRAFHSPLMEPMLDEFERDVGKVELRQPTIRMISAVTGAALTAAEVTSPAYWRRHVRDAVRFADATAALGSQYGVVVEIGPHNVLSTFERDGDAASVPWVATLRRDADDRESMLTALQSLYCAGLAIDWAAVHGGSRLRRVALPKYAFQRDRYWVEPKRQDLAPASAQTGHALLGRRIDSALDDQLFEARVTPERFSFVAAHRVADAIIMPGAGFVEAARAAGAAVAGPDAVVERFELHAAMPVGEKTARLLQTVVGKAPAPEGRIVRVFSRDEDSGSPWTAHASGRVNVASAARPAKLDLDAVKQRCPATVEHAEFYDGLAQRRLAFGAELRGLQRAWVGASEALAEIELPESLRAEAELYGAHPALLDACLQSVALTVGGSADRTALYLPVEMGRYRLLAPVPHRCFAHVRATVSPKTLNADIVVYDERGNAVIELAALRFQSATDAVLRQLKTQSIEQYLYSTDWQPLHEGSSDRRAAVESWIEGLPGDLRKRALEHSLPEYERFFAEFEALCGDFFAQALLDLGWQPGHTGTTAELADRLRVLPRHYRLFGRMLEIVAETGMLRKTAGGWAAGTGAAPRALGERLADLEKRFPGARAELALVGRCGPAFADALRGARDPLELLFPGGSTDDAEALYRDSALATIFNSSVADAVERLASGGRLRVLEIGGGTGGTTSHVLARVGDSVDYTFTDVSSHFTSRARKRFGQFQRVEYKELDLEKDPSEQGFTDGSFDVVLASNVLHATADIRATLERVRRLLAPRGVLIALEVFAPHRWFDLTVGLTPGWWLFKDDDLRPAYPCLGGDAWQRVLGELGFERVRALAGDPAGDGVFARQGIIVAEMPARQRAAGSGEWLILADRAGVGSGLARRLEAAGETCRVVLAQDVCSADARAQRALQRLLEPGGLRGVVHLHALDMTRWGDAVGSALDRELEAACGSALELAAACAAAEPTAVPPAWVVTRGARAVSGDESHLEPAQATLWGLGKTVDLEHPTLPFRRVDLDPSNPYDQSEALAQLLLNGSDERELALRDGKWLAPRLKRWRRPARPAADDAAPYKLTFTERGSIDALQFTAAERRAPGADEVEIRVTASALNFKDVLNVLGLYPGDPGPLGSECAGIVERVGANVTDLAVGDRVMAFAGGGYDRYVLAPARQAVRVPDGLPLERAVTVPIAFLTAQYALGHCGRLAAGDRVLIHAATGGVGMAAVQLARAVGAEIYATAGTDEKRALLAALGVKHVYDSRTLQFADEILRDTGGRGVDVVLNSLADEFVDRTFDVIAEGGRFLEIGKRGIWAPERVAALNRAIDYHVIDWGVTAREQPELIRKLFLGISERLGRGEIEPLPARVFTTERIHDAFRYMAQGKHIGKVVVAHSQAPRALTVAADGTYLVTGGLSGLGLRTAQWLADQGARHLALLGRRPPTAEADEVIAALRQRGVQVFVASVDVSQREALAEVLARLRGTFPALRGVVQSAGVLDDGVLLRQDWARFRTVFGPKVAGTQNLHELTAADSLDFFVMYSSLASLTGSAGQANHAAANAFLDTLAAARRVRVRPALSINWGPWSETGAAVRHGVIDRGATRGLFPITPEEGFGVLELLLQNDAIQVGVANVDWPAFLGDAGQVPRFFEVLHSAKPAETGKVQASGGEQPGWLEQLGELPPARQRAEVLRFVRAEVGRLLGFANADVETDRPLSEIGLDSLLAVEIRNLLGKAFGLTLPATVTFDHPSIEALTSYLLAQKFARSDNERAPQAKSPTDAVAGIEELSDEDVDRLIAARLKTS